MSFQLSRSNRSRNPESGGAAVERLEFRRLLSASGYSFVQLGAFASIGVKNSAATIVTDTQGDIFGVASAGGADSEGAIWELPKSTGVLTLAASFDGTDGESPQGGLSIDGAGDLYGTCTSGGANNQGSVWELLAGSSTINLLASFDDATTSQTPSGQIYVDGSGDVFGTAQGPQGNANGGSIWEYNASNQTLSALVLFQYAGFDGANPYGGLISDGNGNFWGTAYNGGFDGDGDVWKYHLGDSTITDLADFNGTTSGGNPQGGIAMDSAGDLFGTSQGNINNPAYSNIWELSANSSSIDTLYDFPGHTPYFYGGSPVGPVILDSSGDLFGTAEFGGATNQGEVFEIPQATSVTPGAHESIYSFTFGGPHDPGSSVYFDSHGDIFGTTQLGSTKDNGALYELLAPGNIPSTHLAVTQQPTTTLADGDFASNVVVTIEGAGNKTAAFDDSAVTLSIKGSGTLDGTVTVNAVDGVATFSDLSLGTAGTVHIVASDGTLKSANLRPITLPIIPQLSIAQNPVGAVAGQKMGAPIEVNLFDQFGNLLTTNHSAMRAAILSGPAGGKLIAAVAVVKQGVATFSSMVIDRVGSYTLSIIDGKNAPVTAPAFNVTPGAATKMAFLTPPAGSSVDVDFGAQVELLDKFGNVATDDDSTVTAALKLHPAGDILAGTLSQPVVDGIATFSDLELNAIGTCSLEFTDSELVRVLISKPFKITA